MTETAVTPHDPGVLSTTERVVSSAIGLCLAAAAAKPRPNAFLSFIALAAGAALAYRGSTGYCLLKAALAEQRS
jgi:hypothetical protein